MNVFRKVSKRITPYMRLNGFTLSGKNYCRIDNDIAYCIGFDTPSGLLYVTAYIMPLFIPCENKYYTYGNRLNAIQGINLPILKKNDNDTVIDNWCDTLCKYLDREIFPFFKQVGSLSELLEYVGSHTCTSSSFLACHSIYTWRLNMFAYLYMGKHTEVNLAIAHYRNILCDITFLSDQALRKYSEEIDDVEVLMNRGGEAVREYFLCTISDTKGLLR